MLAAVIKWKSLLLTGEKEKDAAALAMAAEALMNLNPWDYYLSSGKMKDSSQEAEQLILQALDIDPFNPLGNHLLIHISEASSPLRCDTGPQRTTALCDMPCIPPKSFAKEVLTQLPIRPRRDEPLSATRALVAANRLAFGKGAWQAHQGHLLHMPSHTFVRTGPFARIYWLAR